ncbi:MAG TPA: phosphotransferase [Terriglobia bacterium]|nr:phosphotransferase [Terriglobia bacterium]
MPQKSRGKVLKAFASKLPWIGAPKWLPQRLTIASKGALPLEALITKLTGEKSPVFAWFMNLCAYSSKINMQVMRPDGEILGYIKLSLSKVASHSLRHEASVLSQLQTYPELRSSVPRVFYHGEWSDGYLIFVSRLAGKSDPLAFTSSHARFLQTLAAIRPVKRDGELLVKEIRRQWEQSLPRLGSEWVEIGQSALEKANRLLAGQSVPCGVIHGDFVPENTMMSNDRLLVFDWERSAAGMPKVWDIFHFHLELAYLLGKKVEDVFAIPESPVNHACWLLYLLGSACRLSEAAQTRARTIRIRYRRQLLSQEVSRWLN